MLCALTLLAPLCAWVGLITASPAHAHNVLRSTSPAAGAQVDQLPDQVILTFDQPCLALGTEVIVTGTTGPVTSGPPQLIDTQVRQPLRGGPAGRYTVIWRATSADAHPVSGTFEFTTIHPTDAAATPAAADTTAAPGTPASSTVATDRPDQPTSNALLITLGVLTALAVIGYPLIRRRRDPTRRQPPPRP